MQPQLALTYDSAAPDSVMGPGWSLAGTSGITRCRATREAGDFIANGVPIDGDPRAVRFHPDDRFCLDGQRLILISTDRNYGDAGAEYRLETDRFTRIYSQGGNNTAYTPTQPNVTYTGPSYFKVQRRDGTTSEYGNSVDSRLEADGQANANMGMVWALNRVEDSSGNYMLFEYDENPLGSMGEQLLVRIRYTGKRQLAGQTAPASTPYATVTLTYESNQEAQLRSSQYQAGARVTRSRLLKSINAAGARHYALTYDASPGDSGKEVLVAVSECADGTLQVCYPPTSFEWSPVKLNLTQSDGPLIAGVKTTVSSRFGDIDGDGRLDLVTFNRASVTPCTSSNRLLIYFADKRTNGSLWLNSGLGGTPICTTFANSGPGSVDQWWQLIDYDGDGRDDLMIAENPGPFANPTNPSARWKIHPSRGRFVNGVSTGGFDTSVDLLQQDGIVLNALDTRAQMQLADFNGDGLADMVYAIVTVASGVESRAYYIRYLERQSGSTAFKFSAPYALLLDSAMPAGHPCTVGECSPASLLLTAGTSRHIYRPQDFDGDGRADLYAVIFEEPPSRITPFLDNAAVEAERGDLRIFNLMYRMGARNESTQSVEVEAIWSSELLAGLGLLPADIRFTADFNADGLPDLLTKTVGWRVCINTGSREPGFVCDASDITGVGDAVQVADIDGNGRTDIVYLPDQNNEDQYRYRLAGPDGRIQTTEYIFQGANVRGREDSDSAGGSTLDFFVDLDGDGLLDFVGIDPLADNQDLKTATSDAANRFSPRDVITEIINGYEAKTSISYLPLTNKEVYRPDRCAIGTGSLPSLPTCTRNKDWDSSTPALDVPGRGSPVVDVMYAMYVTSHVQSDAPTFTNSSSRSMVSYRYVGAKLQAGGRGSLGFRELISTDHNFSGTPLGHVVTVTEYGQRFPHIGFPVRTEKFVVAGGASLPTCRTTDRDKESCRQDFAPGGFAWASRSLVSSSVSGYGTIPAYAPNDQEPLFLHPALSIEHRYELPVGTGFGTQTGSLLSFTVSGEATHDAYGNPTLVGVDVHDVEPAFGIRSLDYEDSVQRRKRTINVYDAPDLSNWRLGRLLTSTVQSSRRAEPGDPLEMQVRVASFSYDTAKAGLLKSEIVQPDVGGDQELRTYYGLDDYGNRIAAYTCSADVTEALCRDPTNATDPMRFHPQNGTEPTSSVRRFSTTSYGSSGRYPVATYEPYFSPGTPVREWVSLASATVLARDIWGEPTHVRDANLVESRARRGSLGREYWSWSATGAVATTTYRWCTGINGGTASCPTGAVFRRHVAANNGALAWTYYDRLGRAMASATASFNINVANEDVSLQCVGYDAHGREYLGTEPRFLPATLVSGTPSFAGQAGACTSAIYRTTSTFDVLGRATQTVGPDGATTSTAFNGLETVSTAPCNNETSQLCNRQFKKLENAAGEVIRATDANDFSVDYVRDPDGNPTDVRRTVGGTQIINSAEFDERGRKTQQSDTDGGTLTFQYNAAGEVIRRTDALGRTLRYDIDGRGRVWRTRATMFPANACTDCLFKDGFETSGLASSGLVEDITQYDTAANGLGMVHWDSRTAAGAATISRTYAYDSLARVSTRHTLLDGKTYTERTIYDNLGRVLKSLVEYTENYNNPSGPHAYAEGVEYAWTTRGQMERVCKAVDASAVASGCPSGLLSTPVYWRVISQDARGQVIKDERHGSVALQSTRGYDAATGRLATLKSGSSNSLQNLIYAYDKAGNLVRREDHRATTRIETFRYDALDRVVESKLNGAALVSLSYDVLGNICSKNGNAYIYAGPAGCAGALGDVNKSAHAVTQAFGNTYRYDANGLQLSVDGPGTADDRFTEYDAHHRMNGVFVGAITSGVFQAEYAYAPDLSLVTQVEINSSSQVSRRTHYVGNLEWTDRNPSGTANREARLGLPGGLVLIKRFIDGQAPTTSHRYLFHDVLGSVDVIADESGVAVERMSFDVHGRRRSEVNWIDPVTYGADATTRRGYTGHEQIDGAGLIHMRARMYDPRLGRFLQPDPMIEPDATQGWNRYSYVLNNPMSATDPSGMLSRREAIAGVRTIAAIVISVYSGQILFGQMCLTPAAAASAAVFGGFTSGLVAGGLQGAITGAFGASMFFGIGNYFSSPAMAGQSAGAVQAQKILAHGIAGGISHELQGGKFGHGFLASGLTEAFAPGIAQIESGYAQVFMAALTSGTVTALSGGKFANGAVTGAFAQAFGSMASGGGSGGEGEWIFPDGGSTDLNDYDTVMTNGILGDRGEFIKALSASPTPAAGYFNPSHGPFADIMESIGQKFFGRTGDPLAAGFARGMAGVDHPMTIIAHSQGTLTVANAVRYYGMSAQGSTFVMKSPALSYFTASRAIQGRGGTMVWRQPYGDIANIYAPSFNPLRWASGFGDIPCGACRHISNGLP